MTRSTVNRIRTWPLTAALLLPLAYFGPVAGSDGGDVSATAGPGAVVPNAVPNDAVRNSGQPGQSLPGVGSLIKEGRRPLASVTFAGVNRFVDEARYIFEAAGQQDAFRVVEEWLGSTLNNLDGFNRDKPFGILVYVPVSFPPVPEFLGFVPVDSIDEAKKLVEKAPVLVRQDADREGRYEIIGPQQTVPMLIRNGYAFFPIGNNPPASALDRELPEPADLIASQARQFDVAVTLDIASIPAGTRTLLSNLLTSGMSPQLQQRDNEPEGAYRVRRAEGERVMASFRQLLDECDRLILGVDVVQDQHAVNFDIVIDALAGTELLQELFESTTKPSRFIPLLDDSAPVSISLSTLMNERDRSAYVEMLAGLKLELTRRIEIHHPGAPLNDQSPVIRALSAIQQTVEAGHMDTFAQFYTDAAQKLAIVGAIRVVDGESLAAGLQDAAVRLQDLPELGEIGALQIGHHEHLGITFHRLNFRNPPREATEIFGQNPGISFGSSAGAIWACLGGDESTGTLAGVMDQLEQADRSPQDRSASASLRLIINTNQLVRIQQRLASSTDTESGAGEGNATDGAGDASPTPATSPPDAVPTGADGGESRGPVQRRSSGFARRRAEAGAIFRETIAEGDDRIVVDFRPTDTGGRVRVRLEEGFVRILGRLIAARIVPKEE